MDTNKIVSTTELRRLLIEIREHGHNVCVRFRLMGSLWQNHMMRVVTVTEDRVMVNDETSNKLISINLSNIIQFELDNRFREFQPHYHYDVSPMIAV